MLGAGLLLGLAGCTEPAAETSGNASYTIQKIESSGAGADGTVRVKLTTPGQLAEADEDSIGQFVQVIARHEATKRQRAVAEARARRAFHKISVRNRKRRYLAVETDPVAVAGAAKAEKSVMVWDTDSQEIVGNDVYDIASSPAAQTLVRFDTYSAVYIDSGM